jgi:hypothetical protein
MRISLAVTLLLLAGSAGCAGQTAAAPTTSAHPGRSAGPVNVVPDGYVGRFRVGATVLENEHHGPQLCVGGVDLSLPPQCGGLDIVGWTWNGLKHESALRTRWGTYLITGRLDGRAFKLTEPAKVSDGSLNREPRAPDFTSPCPAPAGGWRPVDPGKATTDALQAAESAVNAESDFAGLWLDQKPSPSDRATPVNDPTKLVLNVRFTKDLARHEADIRKVWGGALCVSAAEQSLAELDKVRRQFAGEPGMTYAAIDVVTGTVEIGVFVATQARQRELDAKYGPGLVNLVGALEPID